MLYTQVLGKCSWVSGRPPFAASLVSTVTSSCTTQAGREASELGGYMGGQSQPAQGEPFLTYRH